MQHTAIDISSGMHRRALERLHTHRAHKIAFIEDDVLASRLPDASAVFIVSTFGLKTFNAEQHLALAKLTARVLKPGGVFAMIEASDPKGWLLRPLYLFHLKTVLPLVERVILRGAQDFAMIGTLQHQFRRRLGPSHRPPRRGPDGHLPPPCLRLRHQRRRGEGLGGG